MRIGLAIPGGLDPTDVERSIPALQWLVTRLARRHDVEVLSMRQGPHPRSYEAQGARVHDFGLAHHRGPAAAATALVRASSWLAGHEAVDVWHGLWLGVPWMVAALASAWQRRPLVTSIMGTELTRAPGLATRSQASRVVARWGVGRSEHVTVGSAFQAAQAAEYGIHCTVVPLGVPREWFDDSAHDSAGAPRLLHVGDLNRWKDQLTLLDALARVRDGLRDVHLEHAGIDTLGGEIQRAAAARSLGGHVTFHGHVGRSDLRDLFRRATLLVMSSRHESQCVAVVEAAALGVPTVGTRVGLIADGDGTWTSAVRVGDAEALARAVVDLVHDGGRRRALAVDARAWAAAHDADWTAAQFDALYLDAIARRRPSRPHG